jgi:hypothetical protein
MTVLIRAERQRPNGSGSRGRRASDTIAFGLGGWAHLTIALATSGSRRPLATDDSFGVKAIISSATTGAATHAPVSGSAPDDDRLQRPGLTLLLSESRVGGLVRPAYEDDHSGSSRDGVVIQAFPAGGSLPIW